MSILSYFKSLTSTITHRRRTQRSAPVSRLCLETLEDRSLLAFTPLASYAGGAFALAAVDLDGDGRLDLGPVSSFGGPGLSALLGKGDGTFRNAQLPGIGTNNKPVVADLNGDAIDDLVKISDYFDLSVQLGNGDGNYAQSQAITLPSQLPPGAMGLLPFQLPTSMALGDLNADGKLDLVIAAYDDELIEDGLNSRRDHYVNLLIGNGDGTFGQSRSYYVTSTIYSEGRADAYVLGVRDFDSDGKADILTTAGDAVRLFTRNSDGTLQTPPSSFRGSWTTIDVNADGKLDRVDLAYQTTYSGDAPDYTTRFAHVRLGNGDGSFLPVDIVDLGQTYGEVNGNVMGFADFDGNGFAELVVSESRNYGVPGFYVSVAKNDGSWPRLTPMPPAITISDATYAEGNTGAQTATFSVTLSAASTQSISVAYATAGGTATAGSDYQSKSGVLTIPAGQTTGTINVVLNGDRIAESNESFEVNLSNPTNATIADGQGVGTILDDEPRISISDVSKKEGKNGQTKLFAFTVTLSAAYDQPVTMSFKTVNGTATTGNRDYVAKTGTLTFAPGQTSKTITIEVRGDRTKESTETFYLDLFGNTGNSQFKKNRGIGTILNDD